MKKLSKRLLAVALAGVMATTMAVSASASTKITIMSQTLKGLEEKPNNTIAVGSSTNTSLNRTAQNFSISSSNNANLWRNYYYYYGK